jgi:type I restriction-modification system DNA methylase subunit
MIKIVFHNLKTQKFDSSCKYNGILTKTKIYFRNQKALMFYFIEAAGKLRIQRTIA